MKRLVVSLLLASSLCLTACSASVNISGDLSIASEEETETATEDKTSVFTEDMIDYDNMVFYYGGIECKLGEMTLQEFSELGVDFADEVDEQVKSNYIAEFNIRLAEDEIATISVLNNTGDIQSALDCVISGIRIGYSSESAIEQISFNFPLDVTQNDLDSCKLDYQIFESGSMKTYIFEDFHSRSYRFLFDDNYQQISLEW